MSHHLFLLSPSDTPIYSFSHQSTKLPPPSGNTLSTNLPTWSTSPFSSTLTALSGAQSASSVRVRKCLIGILKFICLPRGHHPVGQRGQRSGPGKIPTSSK